MRKTIFRTFIAAALMSFCFSVPAFAENAVVTGTEVNLRSGPGTNYKIINCLAGGSSVQVGTAESVVWDLDGEEGTCGDMSVEICPRAVELIVPKKRKKI